MKLGVGRQVGRGVDERSGGKSNLRLSTTTWCTLGAGEVAQAVLAQVAQRDISGVAYKCGGDIRDEDLTAMPDGHEAGGAICRGAVIVAVALLGGPGVDADASAQPLGQRPLLTGECELRVDRGVDRARR
jgi:hypothetical protein